MAKHLVILTIISLILSVPAVGMAQPSNIDYDHMFDIPGFQMERLAQNLGLTGDQIEQIRLIRLKTQKNIILLRAEAEVKELELREAMRPREPDQDKVFKLAEEIGVYRVKMVKEWLRATMEMKRILSEEQMDKLTQAMNRFKKRHRMDRMSRTDLEDQENRKRSPDRK